MGRGEFMAHPITLGGGEMSYKIDKNIIDKTTNCECEFACLEKGECPKNKCKPTGAFNGYLWVETEASMPCTYHMAFGKGNICKCPTRNEIYKKHGI